MVVEISPVRPLSGMPRACRTLAAVCWPLPVKLRLCRVRVGNLRERPGLQDWVPAQFDRRPEAATAAGYAGGTGSRRAQTRPAPVKPGLLSSARSSAFSLGRLCVLLRGWLERDRLGGPGLPGRPGGALGARSIGTRAGTGARTRSTTASSTRWRPAISGCGPWPRHQRPAPPSALTGWSCASWGGGPPAAGTSPLATVSRGRYRPAADVGGRSVGTRFGPVLGRLPAAPAAFGHRGDARQRRSRRVGQVATCGRLGPGGPRRLDLAGCRCVPGHSPAGVGALADIGRVAQRTVAVELLAGALVLVSTGVFPAHLPRAGIFSFRRSATCWWYSRFAASWPARSSGPARPVRAGGRPLWRREPRLVRLPKPDRRQ